MKFGKQLREVVDESYEEWRPKFMCYKMLKKNITPRNTDEPRTDNITVTESDDSGGSIVKREESLEDDLHDANAPQEEDSNVAACDEPLCSHVPRSETDKVEDTRAKNLAAVEKAEREHCQFFTLFRAEVDKVNDFYLDKQEDYIIEHEQLSSLVEEFLKPGHATRAEMNRLRERLTNFHGQLILLENYSTVNYTGFRKILKKHDKKTGLTVQTIYLQTVLATPFFSSRIIRRLVAKTEGQLHSLDTVTKFRRPNFNSTSCLTARRSAHLEQPGVTDVACSQVPDDPAQVAAASDEPTDPDQDADSAADAHTEEHELDIRQSAVHTIEKLDPDPTSAHGLCQLGETRVTDGPISDP